MKKVAPRVTFFHFHTLGQRFRSQILAIFETMHSIPGFHYRLLLRRILFALFLFIITRLLFLVMNPATFSGELMNVSLAAIRYDLTTITILLIPVVLLHLLPLNINNNPRWQQLISFLYILPIGLSTLFNCIDAAWFEYTQKRTGFDFFALIFTGDDVKNNIIDYLIDYWYVLLFWVLTIVLLIIFEKKNRKSVSEYAVKNPSAGDLLFRILSPVLLISLSVIGFRGGLQLKPLSLQAAARMVPTASIPLVLNTPYSIIKTMGRTMLTDPHYMSMEEAEKIFPVHQKINNSNDAAHKNIVVIILESFSWDYISYYHPEKKTTPFLDSLILHSQSWPNTFANAKRSIEGIPAVIASLPNLMDMAFINSAYNITRINSLASVLKNEGYNSGFFHGGNNGTMGFDNFSRLCGYEKYYGRNEYTGPDTDYDGQWGISDHAYYHFMISELNNWKEPFTAAFFSLSSHHPYYIPPAFKSKIPASFNQVEKGMYYADLSLQLFFSEASKQSWYKNTVFIITADHAGPSASPYTSAKTGAFHIPTVIVNPTDTSHVVHPETAQQSDILPTALALAGYKGAYTAFGRNLLAPGEGWSINYSNNNWSIINDHYLLMFDGTEITHIFDRNDLVQTTNLLARKKNDPEVLRLEKLLKSVLQQYQTGLIQNTLVTIDGKATHTH